MTAKAPILEVKDLAKSFGGLRAVQGVDLALHQGELRCLIGPNGAGKSTVLSMLAGNQEPDSGQIVWKGHDITHTPAHERVRRGISLKFQTTHIYRHLTVAENLSIPRRGSSNGHVASLISDLGLDRNLLLPALELSHAEQQWLEIVLALETGPDLLLLDEPTAGMTVEETHSTAALLNRLNGAGLTILVVEHDMAFVRDVGKRITVLHNGRIFAEGSLSEIEANNDVQRIYLGETANA
jgi:branched-chain amino acid transport system ATP-binding protein